MVVTDYNTKFLDKTGTDYMIDELKTYVDDAVANISNDGEGGDVDLSNYYTKKETYNKAEIDKLIPTVTNGADGKDGVDGITPHIDSDSKHWFIGDTDTGVAAKGQDGAKGDKGDTGEQGIQGEKGDSGKDGINGADGQDGFSPIATVIKSGNTATITITDKNGTTTASISDGKDGTGGGGSSDGSGEIYSMEETAIGTWIDGKTVYQRIFDLTDFASKKSNGFQLYSLIAADLVIDEVVDSRLIVKNNSVTYTSSEYLATIGTQSSVTGVVNAVNSNIINRAIFHSIITSATDTVFQVYIGTNYSGIRKMYLTLKYTKLDS